MAIGKHDIVIRRLNAAYGWTWINHGWKLIMINPRIAIMSAMVLVFALLVVLSLPLFGPLFAVVLMPVLMAVYMRICRALEEEEVIDLKVLFKGFSFSAMRLVALGGFTLMGTMFAAQIMLMIGGEALAKLLERMSTINDPQVFMDAVSTAGAGVGYSLIVGFALIFMLMMALQFAPMLIFFNGLQPFAALRVSLLGSLSNLVPYILCSLILQLAALVLGLLPFGIGLILLLPLGLTSLFVSYRNIFPFPGEIIITGEKNE